MFDWIPEMLYFITKTILMLIDGFISISNVLCGIEPIHIGNEETDFLSYILYSEQVSFAFKTAILLGIIVVFFATIFQMLKNISKEGVEGSPLKVCFKALKTLLVFAFVPLCMFLLVWIGNEFIIALYKSTSNGSTSLGAFLFTIVGELDGLQNGAKFLDGTFDYRNVGTVWFCIDLWDYNHFLVWLVGGLLLYNILSALMSFIDRVISIVILYIVSPFSVASSIVDDGSHFKLWRDQVLVKFFSSYGMIIALNIFVILTSLVINPDLYFFENEFLNFCIKVLVILGGGLGLSRTMALIGNLISSGAGSNELREANQTKDSVMKALATPLSPASSILGEAMNQKKRDLAGRALSSVGLGIRDNGQTNENGEKDSSSGLKNENQNTNSPNYNNNKKGVSLAIANDFGMGDLAGDSPDGNDDNKNDKNPMDVIGEKGGKMVEQAIINSVTGGAGGLS
jgi:hypothetical protein